MNNSVSSNKKRSLLFFVFKEFAGLSGDVRFLKHNLEYQQSIEPLKDVVSESSILFCS